MKLCLTTVTCTWYTVGIQNKGSKAFVTKLTFIELLELCWVYTTHIALWLHIALWFPHGFLLHGVTVNNLGFSHIRGARTHTSFLHRQQYLSLRSVAFLDHFHSKKNLLQFLTLSQALVSGFSRERFIF